MAAFFGAVLPRRAEDDDEVFEQDDDDAGDERVEVDVDDDDDDLPPWTAGDAAVMRGAPSARRDERGPLRPGTLDAARRRGEVRGRAVVQRRSPRSPQRSMPATRTP